MTIRAALALPVSLLLLVPLPAAGAEACPGAFLELRAALEETDGQVTPRLAAAVEAAVAACPAAPPSGLALLPQEDNGCEAPAEAGWTDVPLALSIAAGDVERVFQGEADATARTWNPGGHHLVDYYARDAFGLYADDGGLGTLYLGDLSIRGRGDAGAGCDGAGTLCAVSAQASYLGVFRMTVRSAAGRCAPAAEAEDQESSEERRLYPLP